jgi:hypothetical protein
MMHRFSSLLVAGALVLGLAASAGAQVVTSTATAPLFEFSAAYQLLRVSREGGSNTYPTGFTFDGARYFGPLGFVGELGWSNDSTSVPGTSISTSYLHVAAGARFLFVRREGVRPYVQVLGGIARAKDDTEISVGDVVVTDQETTDTAFIVQPGAGITFPVGDAWGVFGGVDYRRAFFDEGPGTSYSNTNEFRAVFGVRLIID